MMGRVCAALSVAIPLCLYIATAAPGPYWLDSGELVASSYLLGIPHPPGHPLYTALTHPASLLPIGSIALRINVMSGVFAASSCGVLYWTCRRALTHMGVGRPWNHAAGVAAALLAGTSYALWFQAVRAEVYSLHLLLAALAVALAVGALTGAKGHDSSPDIRIIYTLALVVGLGFANHHYLMLFVAAPIVGTLAFHRATRRSLTGWRGPRAAGFGMLGLATYALLPARAIRNPLVNWGDPDTPGEFLWVVSAQAFQKALDSTQQLDTARLAVDLFVQIGRQITPVGLVLAVVGIGWLFKSPRGRVVAALVTLLIAANLTTQSLFNFDPFNPDVHGYFALTAWLLALGVGLSIGGLVSLARRLDRPRLRPVVSAAAVTVVGALIVTNAALTAPHARLDGFHDVDLNNIHLLEPLPAGALVLTSNYKTIFNVWYAQGVERRRPSVEIVHRNFLSRDSYIERLRAQSPSVAALAADPGEGNQLDLVALRALARNRPVFLEYDVNVGPRLARHLVPEGLLFRVSGDPVPPGPLPQAIQARQRKAWLALEHSLADGGRTDGETRRHLLWQHYVTVLGLAKGGHWPLAKFHLDRALALNPKSPELQALRSVVYPRAAADSASEDPAIE
jgi:hypothetical protein